MDDIGSPKQLLLKDYDFLPSLEIRTIGKSSELEPFKIRSEYSDDLEILQFIDPKKLSAYVEVNMMLGRKLNGVMTYQKVPFINCREEDFRDLAFAKKVKARLCPDF